MTMNNFKLVLVVMLVLFSTAYSTLASINTFDRNFYFPYKADFSSDVGVRTDMILYFNPVLRTDDKSLVIKGNPDNLYNAEVCKGAKLDVSYDMSASWASSKFNSISGDGLPKLVWYPSPSKNPPTLGNIKRKFMNKIIINSARTSAVRNALKERVSTNYRFPVLDKTHLGKEGYVPITSTTDWVKEPIKYFHGTNLLDTKQSLGYVQVVCDRDYTDSKQVNGKEVSYSSKVTLKNCLMIVAQPDENGNLVDGADEVILPTDTPSKSNDDPKLEFTKPMVLNVNDFAHIKYVDPKPKLKVVAFMMVDKNGKFDLVNNSFPISNGVKTERVLMKFTNTGDVTLKVTGLQFHLEGADVGLINTSSEFNKKALHDLENKEIKPGESETVTLDLMPSRVNLGRYVDVNIFTKSVSKVCNQKYKEIIFNFNYPVKYMNDLTSCKIKPEDKSIILGIDDPNVRFNVLCEYGNSNNYVPCDYASDISWDAYRNCNDWDTDCKNNPGFTSKPVHNLHDSLDVHVYNNTKAIVNANVRERGNWVKCDAYLSAQDFSYGPYNPKIPNLNNPIFIIPSPIYPSIGESTVTGCTLTPSTSTLNFDSNNQERLDLTCGYEHTYPDGTTSTYTAPCSKTYLQDGHASVVPQDGTNKAGVSVYLASNDTTYKEVDVIAISFPSYNNKVIISMKTKDGKDISCNSVVNVAPKYTPSTVMGCALTPSSSTLDLKLNNAEDLALKCKYNYTDSSGTTYAYEAPCSTYLVHSVSVSQSENLSTLDLSVTKNNTDYTGVDVTAKSVSSNNKVTVSMQTKDGKDISCNSVVNVTPGYNPSKVMGCTLTPSSSTLDLKLNNHEKLNLTCEYQYTDSSGNTLTNTAPCSTSLVNSVNAYQSINPGTLSLSVSNNNTDYTGVDVTAKSVSSNNKVTVSMQTKDGKDISCNSVVNVTNVQLADLESCTLSPANVVMKVGGTKDLGLTCIYKLNVNLPTLPGRSGIKGSIKNGTYIGPCYKTFMLGGRVNVTSSSSTNNTGVNASLVLDNTTYTGVTAGAVDPSYNKVSVNFITSKGATISCDSRITVNANNNNTNNTNTTINPGNGGGGNKETNGNGFWCTVVGPGKVYTDSTEKYSVECYSNKLPVDCLPPRTNVTWNVKNIVRSGVNQLITFGPNPGTETISANWNLPTGSISCGPITIVSEVPTCFKFI